MSLGKSALLLALIFSAMAFAEPRISVRSYVQIKDKADVMLSDIVRLQDISEKVQREVKKIRLGDAPELNERKAFTREALTDVFRSRVRAWSKIQGDKIQLQIPEEAVVEHKGHEITEDLVVHQLKKRFQDYCQACKIEIKNLQLPKISKKHQGQVWKVRWPRALPKGNFSMPLEFGKEESATYWISGDLIILKKVPVATRALFFGQRLQEGDLKKEWRDVTFAIDGFPDIGQSLGRRLSKSVKVGDIIYANSVEREKALSRGEVVKVISGSKEWQVTLSGIAQEDGYLGDMVKVRNPTSKKVISGLVVDKGKVELQ